jgi:hypothetical protein
MFLAKRSSHWFKMIERLRKIASPPVRASSCAALRIAFLASPNTVGVVTPIVLELRCLKNDNSALDFSK